MTESQDLISAVARLSRMLRRHPKDPELPSHMGHRVLHLVMEHNGIRTTELAALAGVRPASITEALNHLEKHGFITRERDVEDCRVKRIYIADKARRHIEAWNEARQRKNAQMLACLTEEEAAFFLSICDKLCTFLESKEAAGGHHE